MKTKLMTAFVTTALILAVAFNSFPVIAQDRPTDDMQILREKVRADKKLVVAINMDLTESEAKGFWPIYESYQKDLEGINQRLAKLIINYAQEYNAKTLSDEKAQKLTDEMLTIEAAEVSLRKSYAPKLGKILPARKVARYLQIENKIRAIVKYELAAGVPLVQ
jgi:predicted outer membrane protein